MKTRPVSITILGILYMFMPFVDIAFEIYLKDWPLYGPRGFFTHVSLEAIVFWMLMPFVGFGILRVSRWGYLSFLAYSAILITYKSFIYFQNPNYSLYNVLLLNFFSLGVVGYFLQKHIAAPYFNPKMRWWQRDHRFSVNLAAQLRYQDKLLHCNVLDISKGGCFIETNVDFHISDVAWLRIQLSQHDFTALGKVTWVNKKGLKGVGIQFTGMGKRDRKALGSLIAYLRSANPHMGVDESIQSHAAKAG